MSDLRFLGAAQAYAAGLKYGVCPCKWPHESPPLPLAYVTMAEDDPGPRHIPTCPFADEDYVESL